MQRIKFQIIGLPLTILFLFIWIFSASSLTLVLAQEPTPTFAPQVSSTGMYITVLGDEPFANIRMGPSSSVYAVVGQLFPGDTAPAIGRSPGGDWIQIEFVGAPNNKGWVYSPLVSVSPPGTLQIVEPPPTPVPPPTATIDPTLAAQFNIVPTNTRPPTFTPPPSLTMPVFTQDIPATNQIPVSTGVIIITLSTVGILGFILSLFITRR